MKKLGISRRALYEQLDRPALQPLPATRYVLAYWKHCRANMDYHIVVERHDYSVPFQLLREQVEVRFSFMAYVAASCVQINPGRNTTAS